MALSLFGGPLMSDFPFGRGWATRDPMDFGALLPSLGAVSPVMSAHPMDVIETGDAFKVTVDAPGMDAGDISITMQEGVLTIAGKKKTEVEEKDREGRVLRRERGFTSFSRSFTMPENVDEDKVSASLMNGVLQVMVPKIAPAPKPEPRRIAIETAPAAKEMPKVTQHAHHAAAGEATTH